MRADLALGLPPAPDWTFAACALLSLALHGAVAGWTFAGRPAATAALPPLVATLRLVAPEPPRDSAPAPRPAAVVVQPRPPAARTENSAASRALPAEQPAPLAMAAPAVSPAPSAVAEAAPPPVPAAGEPAPAPVATAPVAAPPTGAAARAETLAAYRRQLAEAIGRVRAYPRIAALRGWEGEVRLTLRIARKGNLLAIALEHSSGFEVLDRHALAMVEELPALPPLPETLESNEIQVVVPVSYRLRSAT